MLDLFIQIRIVDIIDIVLVALLLYGLYRLLKGTAAISIFVGIVAIFLISQLVNALQMELLSSILGAFVSVGFIALIIIFQPEIRRFLFTIGSQTKSGNLKVFHFMHRKRKNIALDAETICQACRSMSNIKQGALIVITRQNTLTDIVLTGVTIVAGTCSRPSHGCHHRCTAQQASHRKYLLQKQSVARRSHDHHRQQNHRRTMHLARHQQQ